MRFRLLAVGAGLWLAGAVCAAPIASYGSGAPGNNESRPDGECEQKATERGLAVELERRLADWARHNEISLHDVSLESPKTGATQELLFAMPSDRAGHIDGYADAVGVDTVSFGYTKGWFGGEAGRPPFHAFVRVGGTVYEYGSDGDMNRWGFAAMQRWLLSRDDLPTTYEVVFSIPSGVRQTMERYYEERFARTAQIEGSLVDVSYDVGGWGELKTGEHRPKLSENCVSFALSFCQVHWQQTYPDLKEICDSGGLSIPQKEKGLVTPGYLSHLVFSARPVAVLVWRRAASPLPADEAIWDFLTMMRVVKHYKLQPENVRRTERAMRRGDSDGEG